MTKLTDYQKDQLLNYFKQHLAWGDKPVQRGHLIAELPQAYNAWMDTDTFTVARQESDGSLSPLHPAPVAKLAFGECPCGLCTAERNSQNEYETS